MSSNDYKFSVHMIESFHESHKWLWAVVLSVAIFNALSGLNDELEEMIASGYEKESLLNFFGTFGLVLVLLLFIVRFYAGDSRILAFLYRDLPMALCKAAPDESIRNYIKRFDSWNAAVDGYIRVLQYIVLAFLALNVRNPVVFSFLLTFLLVGNAGYCYLVAWSVKRGESRDAMSMSDHLGYVLSDEAVKLFPDLSDTRKFWAKNNLGFAILIGIVLISYGVDLIDANILAYLVCLLGIANSFNDLRCARKIYFPNLWVLTLSDKSAETGGQES